MTGVASVAVDLLIPSIAVFTALYSKTGCQKHSVETDP